MYCILIYFDQFDFVFRFLINAISSPICSIYYQNKKTNNSNYATYNRRPVNGVLFCFTNFDRPQVYYFFFIQISEAGKEGHGNTNYQ